MLTFLKLLTLFFIFMGLMTVYFRIAKFFFGMGTALMVVLILICI